MTRARILEKDVFPCFEAGLLDEAGEAVNAEISAVVWDGRRLVMASDKPIPGKGRSAVFALECVDGRPQPDTLVYYTAPLIRSSRKYEDFALTVGGKHVIATTGFDRIKKHSTAQDQYNELLIWPSGNPDAVRVVDGKDSSVRLRDSFKTVLGAPYFKIEGLAAIPGPSGSDDWLMFGVREIGRDHDAFEYACTVVAAPYRIEGDDLEFTGDFDIVYDFDPRTWPGVRFEVGVSSLEYDPYNERLYLLTSFETEDADGNPSIGGYLWAMPITDFHAQRDPTLVENESGEVLEFVNKAEGLAVLDSHRLLLAYDPDRELGLGAGHSRSKREPHEAPYTLLAME